MIRYGPSGIPLSCKGRTLRDGIEDVHILGLTALEVQVLRTNVIERYATEEEEGMTAKESMNEIIVEVMRGSGKKREPIYLDEPIEKGDIIWTMANSIARDYMHLKELNEIARNLDVELSLHTPYYMDLVADNDLTEKSLDSIRWAGLMAKELGATIVTTHLGMYGDVPKKTAYTRIRDNIRFLAEWYADNGLDIPIGIETSGRQEIFGDFDEVIKLCKEVNGIVPVLNLAHIHARGNGALKKKEDFQEIFDITSQFVKNKFHTNFSGVEHEDGNEIRYTPIKKGDLKFEPLAECVLDNDFDITLICGSPLLEHDAMYMKVILERVLAKREAKAERQRLKDEAKEEKKAADEKKEEKKATKKEPASKKKDTKKKESAAKKNTEKKAPTKKKNEKKPAAKKPAAKKSAAKKKK